MLAETRLQLRPSHMKHAAAGAGMKLDHEDM